MNVLEILKYLFLVFVVVHSFYLEVVGLLPHFLMESQWMEVEFLLLYFLDLLSLHHDFHLVIVKIDDFEIVKSSLRPFVVFDFGSSK